MFVSISPYLSFSSQGRERLDFLQEGPASDPKKGKKQDSDLVFFSSMQEMECIAGSKNHVFHLSQSVGTASRN